MPSVSPPQIVHRETMFPEATPERVRRFIMTPARILDYFPDPIEGEVLEAGKAILCRGAMATSILEVLEAESTADCLVVKVTSAIGLGPASSPSDPPSGPNSGPNSAQHARQRVEEAAVRQGAQHETAALVEGWNRAALEH